MPTDSSRDTADAQQERRESKAALPFESPERDKLLALKDKLRGGKHGPQPYGRGRNRKNRKVAKP